MKLGFAIEQVAAAERELADRLLEIGERHADDHDVYHLSRTLAKMERGHLDALTPHAQRYGADLSATGQPGNAPVKELSESLLLLSDLRDLHVLAAGVSLDWVALAQGAQAAKDTELLGAVTACHDETLRTLKWTTYRLKEAAPQALTS